MWGVWASIALTIWGVVTLPVALMLGWAIQLRDRDRLWRCTPIELQPIVEQHTDYHARSRGSLGVEL